MDATGHLPFVLFVTLVAIIPLGIFICATANEGALPVSSGLPVGKNASVCKSIVDWALKFLPQRCQKQRGGMSRREAAMEKARI